MVSKVQLQRNQRSLLAINFPFHQTQRKVKVEFFQLDSSSFWSLHSLLQILHLLLQIQLSLAIFCSYWINCKRVHLFFVCLVSGLDFWLLFGLALFWICLVLWWTQETRVESLNAFPFFQEPNLDLDFVIWDVPLYFFLLVGVSTKL